MSRRVPFLVLASLVAGACAPRAEHRVEGQTMGTTYHVTVITHGPGPGEGLQAKIDGRLDEVNRHLSTWIEDSEISRFNRSRAVGEEFPASDDFLRVFEQAASRPGFGR
jgi:thiamine biosynthesis lipoprotein